MLSSHSANWYKCSVTWTWIYSINAVPHRVFNFAKRLFQYIHFECYCVSHSQIHIFEYLSTRNDNSHRMTHALLLSEHFPSLWPSPLCDYAFAVAIFPFDTTLLCRCKAFHKNWDSAWGSLAWFLPSLAHLPSPMTLGNSPLAQFSTHNADVQCRHASWLPCSTGRGNGFSPYGVTNKGC